MLERGIQYSHSSHAHDCLPFYTRAEDTWTKIDYSAASASSWMKPLVRGELTGLVEIPASWALDDLPPHMFIKGHANSHGFVDTDVTLKLWKSAISLHNPERNSINLLLMLAQSISRTSIASTIGSYFRSRSIRMLVDNLT